MYFLILKMLGIIENGDILWLWVNIWVVVGE